MDNNSVDVISRETVFKGYFRVDKYQLRIKTFEGGWSEPMSREVFFTGHAAAVLLYDPQRDAVVLIEQFRIAPYLRNRPAWLIECVAGFIDAGEAPEQAARRETKEEAGCDIIRLEKINEWLVSPGTGDEMTTLYVGQVDSSQAGGVFGLSHEHENIRVSVIPALEAIALADQGKILNVTTLVALLWLGLHHNQLRERWSDKQ